MSDVLHPVIVVHGGAWFIPPAQREAFIAGCRQAARVGWAHLVAGGPALDAVEAAVRVMEDDPTFNAGRGSHFNRSGDVETDAIIMDGATLDLGAVASVQGVQNPVSLARLVMTRSPHNFIVGAGAQAFAREMGVPLVEPALMMGTPRIAGWSPPEEADTVGAVALDTSGNLAVAASTGGTADKWPGRVGDSPLVGCGAYADNAAGAASATGHGEKLMRVVISKTACDYLAAGRPAQETADAVIRLLYGRLGGYGGIILVDRYGHIGLAHNTPNMAYAYILPGHDVVAGAEIP
ncbi:MAG: isoaspartyl peptidase/L-asparaginase [Anaerolineae bacterium]